MKSSEFIKENIKIPAAQRPWMKMEEEELNEIERIPRSYYPGGKEVLPIRPSVTGKKIIPLPGGSGLGYYIKQLPTPIGSDGPGMTIYIVDPNKPSNQRDVKDDIIVGMLALSKSRILSNAYNVDVVTVDEAYRGRGIGHSLYGIALSILKVTLLAGDKQTKDGARMWNMLHNFPGVQINGYFHRPRKVVPGELEYYKKIGATQGENGFWFFPVKQGKNELKGPAEIYGQHNNTGLIARWTGN